MTSLFLDQGFQPHFEKIAASVKLSDNPDKWQMEIASELFKQIPYLNDYSVNVIIERMSPERGYAFGSAEIANKTEAPLPDQPKEFIRIPVIVKDRLMLPPDVFTSEGKVFPLTEARLREHLLRTDAMELSTRKPTDQGLVDQLYPPLRTNYGYGNAVATGVGAGGFGKQASLLEWIAPTVPEHEVERFVSKLAEDQETQFLAARNPNFQKLATILVGAPRVGVEKTAEILVEHIVPTVVQLTKLANGNVRVRWANRNAFLVKEAEVPPEQANEMVGEGGPDMSKIPPGAVITASTEKAKKNSLIEENYEKIEHFGTYKVHNADTNEEMEGFALPIIDLEMQPLDLFVWTDGQGQYSVQDEIAGAKQDHDPENIPTGEPQGDGCFFFHDPQGAKALLPMTIHNSMDDEGGTHSFQGETMFGEPVVITPTPGLEAIQELAPEHYAIPQGCEWLPLGEPIHLVKSPEELEHVSEAQKAPGAVDVKSTGQDDVSMEGAPLDKVASEQKTWMNHQDAEFMLVAMGASPFEVREKLASLGRNQGHIKIAGLLPITPLEVLHAEMVKKAANMLLQLPDLHRNLIKEAAALEDSETVDKVLSMNFINPENVGMFAERLPELEETVERLAEMLFAARMGLSHVPEGAVERAMKNLEEVIQGLKALQQKQVG
jgi:hypothetical protein